MLKVQPCEQCMDLNGKFIILKCICYIKFDEIGCVQGGMAVDKFEMSIPKI